jgi:hypothetical protein
MSKVVKITEADLRRIISENLEGDVSEDGFFGMLAKKAASGMKTFSNNSSKPLLKKHLPTHGYNSVVSTMRSEVVHLLAKTPIIKITPKTVKAIEEPKYFVRSAFDNVDDVSIIRKETGIGDTDPTYVRGEYSTIHWKLERITKEFSKPVGQQLNIKQVMYDLYSVRDDISQDLFKRKNLPNAQKELQAPLNRVISAINHLENLFKTPDKPTSYLVKEEPKL